MKKTSTIPFLLPVLMLGFATTVLAQAQLPFIKVSEVYLMPNIWVNPEFATPQEDYRQLAPNSSIAHTDFDLSQFESYRNNTNGRSLGVMLGLQLATADRQSYHAHSVFRVGFSLQRGQYLNDNYRREDLTRVDTVQHRGRSLPVDSVHFTELKMAYQRNSFNIHMEYLWRSAGEKNWSFYLGAGGSAGIALMPHSEYTYTESNYRFTPDEALALQDNHRVESLSVKERATHSPSFSFSLYAPVGFDVLLGRKDNWLSHWHAFYELRPAIHFVHIPELYSMSRFHLYHGPGLRYSF